MAHKRSPKSPTIEELERLREFCSAKSSVKRAECAFICASIFDAVKEQPSFLAIANEPGGIEKLVDFFAMIPGGLDASLTRSKYTRTELVSHLNKLRKHQARLASLLENEKNDAFDFFYESGFSSLLIAFQRFGSDLNVEAEQFSNKSPSSFGLGKAGNPKGIEGARAMFARGLLVTAKRIFGRYSVPFVLDVLAAKDLVDLFRCDSDENWLKDLIKLMRET
jgi:hypothetical protein